MQYKIINKIFLLSVLIIFLNMMGCTKYTQEQNKYKSKIKNDEIKINIDNKKINAVTNLPNIKKINWEKTLQPVVNIMLLENYNKNGLLLINNMKNDTNGNIQTEQPTNILSSIIKKNKNKFKLITKEEINSTCMTLGINTDKILESRDKAMTLANYLNAKYVLYSILQGNIKKPHILLQLMLVKNGEIIWEGRNIVSIENN